MGSIPIGTIIVALLFGSAMLAMALGRWLPEQHLSAETKNVVSVSVAVVGTLSALVLGLLLSTANASFIGKTQEVTRMSTDVMNLDRLLRRYGPPARDIHTALLHYTSAKLVDVFPDDPDHNLKLESDSTVALLESVQDSILALTPANETQSWLKSQALALSGTMTAARWQLGQDSTNRSPVPLMVLVLFWFVIIFASFGLFSPRNTTAISMIFLCAVAVGCAIRMTTELETPFRGLIRVSSAPLVLALDVISR